MAETTRAQDPKVLDKGTPAPFKKTRDLGRTQRSEFRQDKSSRLGSMSGDSNSHTRGSAPGCLDPDAHSVPSAARHVGQSVEGAQPGAVQWEQLSSGKALRASRWRWLGPGHKVAWSHLRSVTHCHPLRGWASRPFLAQEGCVSAWNSERPVPGSVPPPELFGVSGSLEVPGREGELSGGRRD